MEQEIVIKIENLTKKYRVYSRKKDRIIETLIPFIQKHGEFTAVDSLNLEIKKGEILGILGRNGAGKSTLLKMITGVVTPTNGIIEINGKISSLLELGTAFNPELTGYENIYQHGQVFGYTKEQMMQKEKEIIDFADIGDHINQPVKTYSSGMFARLAFACAINVDPDILIVDEVLSVGDMAFQLKCFKKFEDFKKRNKTIIFVTHSINDILKNCNRAIIMQDGKKIFDGGTKEGVENYKKLITGMLDLEDRKEKIEDIDNQNSLEESVNDFNFNETWKEKFNLNPEYTKYGTMQAEVIDFGVFNLKGEPISIIDNQEEVIFRSKIKFNDDIVDPIFTMTIKDFRGIALCGTNTLIKKVHTGNYKKGDIIVAEFKQVVSLVPDKYTVSFGCTQYDLNGELIVYNRNYDVMFIEIVSENQTVGIYDLNSEISLVNIK